MSWANLILSRLLLVAMTVLVGLLVYDAPHVLADYNEVAAAYESLSDHIGQLEQDNHLLRLENERLVSDMAYYEQLGRELFGLVKENETVFIVELP